MHTKTVRIPDLDPFVPHLTEDEQRQIVEAMEAGFWEIEMDEKRYNKLWCQSFFNNADIILRTEEAMRQGVKLPTKKPTDRQ